MKVVQRLAAVFLFSSMLLLRPAVADGLRWEIKVPIYLSNMPDEITDAVVRWQLYDNNMVKTDEGKETVPVTLDSKGDFSTVCVIDIGDGDVKDASKVNSCFLMLELSKGGASYPPDTDGEAWTASKKGSKLVKIVTLVKMQTVPEQGPLYA